MRQPTADADQVAAVQADERLADVAAEVRVVALCDEKVAFRIIDRLRIEGPGVEADAPMLVQNHRPTEVPPAGGATEQDDLTKFRDDLVDVGPVQTIHDRSQFQVDAFETARAIH